MASIRLLDLVRSQASTRHSERNRPTRAFVSDTTIAQRDVNQVPYVEVNSMGKLPDAVTKEFLCDSPAIGGSELVRNTHSGTGLL